MMAMTMTKAAAGDPAAIRDMNFLRSIGVVKDEPKVEEELKVWEIFDMCLAARKQRRRDYWMQQNQMQ
jgi:ABC-type multidrug transport system ATPase subunit